MPDAVPTSRASQPGPTPSPAAERRSPLAMLASWDAVVVLALVVVVVMASGLVDGFASGRNVGFLLLDVVPIALIALPMTLVIITGEIDLSVASTLGLTSAVMGQLWLSGLPLEVIVPLCVVLGAVLGAVNGLFITRFGLPSLAVTIGTLALYRGLAFVVLGDQAVADFPVPWTDRAIAQVQVKLISQAIGGKGKIAILSATPNATNQNAWIALMKTELQKPENSGLQLVTTAYGNDDDQKSFTETQGLLRSYPDLKGIISPTTVGIAAAARYLSSSQYKGKVALTGLGTPNQMRSFVKDGTVKAFALWNPADLGYLAAYAGAALASGQITGAQGEKFKAGKLGEKTIEKNGVIVLGPPTEFTAQNIDQFHF